MRVKRVLGLTTAVILVCTQALPAGFEGFDREAYIKGAAADKTVTITESDCVVAALKNNSDILISRITPSIEVRNVNIEKAKFDPVMYANLSTDDNTELTSMSLSGANPSKTKTGVLNFGVDDKLTSGAVVSLDFLNTRTLSNSAIQSMNPAYDSKAVLSVSQPMARGAGIFVNKASVYLASNNKLRSEQNLIDTVIKVVTEVKKSFYALVFMQEQVSTAKQSCKRVASLDGINRARYQKGLASDVDLLQSEAEIADAEEKLVSAEANLKLAEDHLKLVTNLVDDPELWNAGLVATGVMDYEHLDVDVVEAINAAFANRPDYKAAQLDLKNRDINVRFTHNGLFPQIDLVGSFGLNGLDKAYPKDLAHVGAGNYREWSAGVNVSIPLENMDAKARYDKAKFEKQQAIIAFKRLEQKIILDVRDAVRRVEANFRIARATNTSKNAQQKQYEAQLARFNAGLVSTHDIIDYQERLTRAEEAFIKGVVGYQVSLVELAKAKATALKDDNIIIE